MIQRRTLANLNPEPLYNTLAAARQSNVPPDTFRAWERRYGMPRPFRTSDNERLYSERDIGVIGWLRDRTKEGMTISRAVQRLRIEFPDLFREVPHPTRAIQELQPDVGSPPRLLDLCDRLVNALIDLDDFGANRILDQALGLFTIEASCLSVIRPTLIEVGARWERGDIPAGIKHLAIGLITRRLLLIFNVVSAPTGRGRIMTVGIPGEEHEVGLLILSIFLARRNWRVIYLGEVLPVDDLLATVEHVEPDLVCIGAVTAQTAASAYQAAEEILRGPNPAPAVAFAGRAFTTSEAVDVRTAPLVRGVHFLDGPTDELDGRVAAIVDQRNASLRAHRLPRPEIG